MASGGLLSMNNDLPRFFTDLKLWRVFAINGDVIETPNSLGYYCNSHLGEYPIQLTADKKNNDADEWDHAHFLPVIMDLFKSNRMNEPIDICTNQGTLLKVATLKTYENHGNYKILAIKVKNCIYLKHVWLPITNKASGYIKHLSDKLFVDDPSEAIPSFTNRETDKFGIFTAKLGKFRVLYSSQIFGLTNTAKLGDLNDPEELKQCRFTAIKTYPEYILDIVGNYRMRCWLLQCLFSGIDEFKIAACDYLGSINMPITTVKCSALLKQQPWHSAECMQLLLLFFNRVQMVMGNINCPYTTFIFNIDNDMVSYQRINGKNEHSFLSEEYIDFILNGPE